MKYSIFMFFLLCSLSVFGQDLIITSTGDSLKCKIIEVDADEIQFRFGASGNVISIKRGETESYEYNFAPASITPQKEKNRRVKTVRIEKENLPYFAAISTGTTSFGSVSFGETKGAAMAFGVDAAYFFKQWLGGGLKLNIENCDVDFGESYFYHDRVTFYGPALYARWGKEKFFATACASVGGLRWKLSNQMYHAAPLENKTCSSVGTFLSVGVSYYFTQQIGFGLNLQSLIGSMKDKEAENIKRHSAGIGCTLGVNFRF